MATEITIISDKEDLPSNPEFEDLRNTMLILVRIDMLLMSQEDAPERVLDDFLSETKQEALNHFYTRYPERMPDAR